LDCDKIAKAEDFLPRRKRRIGSINKNQSKRVENYSRTTGGRKKNLELPEGSGKEDTQGKQLREGAKKDGI